MNKTTWPEEVLMLTDNNMCRNVYATEDGTKMCLLGWSYEVFPSCLQQRNLVRAALTKSIEEVAGKSYTGGSIHFANDNIRRLSLVARIWNRAMYLLGYTENNDEKKKLKQQLAKKEWKSHD